MTMYRVLSTTTDGVEHSHGWFCSRERAEHCITELSQVRFNSNTIYSIREVNY